MLSLDALAWIFQQYSIYLELHCVFTTNGSPDLYSLRTGAQRQYTIQSVRENVLFSANNPFCRCYMLTLSALSSVNDIKFWTCLSWPFWLATSCQSKRSRQTGQTQTREAVCDQGLSRLQFWQAFSEFQPWKTTCLFDLFVCLICLFVCLILYGQVNNFSFMSGQVFLGWTSSMLG